MSKLVDYYKVVAPKPNTTELADSQMIGGQGTYANYTWYQRLVQGSAARVTRYREYDVMDNDIEIARSLDTIAEEMMGSNPNSDVPIKLVVDQVKDPTITPALVATLNAALKYWCDLHDWNNRIFKIARVTAKYGDCFFIRRSDVGRWEFVHPKHFTAAIVDDRDMTNIIGWHVKRDVKAPNSTYNPPNGTLTGPSEDQLTLSVDEVVRFTLNDDMSDSAPFGESILRAVYRAQKQKELLEDAIIIYRIQRAPERRVFYIDVGKMPPQRVKAHLESIKNEIRQRKIPTNGGGADQVDSVYNPQQMSEDFFFARKSDGAGSKVETLPGGAGLGELSDLEYFQRKVFRGLRIPLSYMQEQADGGTQFNDGKIGIAYIQELRFAMYIKRLQGHLSKVFDAEFKRYLKAAGLKVNTSSFHIKLNEPENFGLYRQQELDSNLLNTFSQTSTVGHLSKRFAMKKYLQLTDEEILTNYRQRLEELGGDPNDKDVKKNMQLVYGEPSVGDDMSGLGGGMVAGSMGGSMFDQPIDQVPMDTEPTSGVDTLAPKPTEPPVTL